MELTTKYYQLEYKNAAVRWVKSEDVEIIRRIYGAVRDHNWGTLEPEILEETIVRNKNGFEIDTVIVYKKNKIHFEAEIKITGSDKYLMFHMQGIAKSAFETCRTGICVLHPIKECAGKGCLILHTDNTLETLSFPDKIKPSQCMKDMKGIRWYPAKGKKAELRLSGDVFEMEDQRNWTDASYKTYCRPLELPFPFKLEANEEINQKVELFINVQPNFVRDERTVVFKIDKDKQFNLPKLGTCVSSREKPLTAHETSILKRLPFSHLRYEVKLYNEKWKDSLQKAINESNLTEWPLFLVLYFSDDYEAELKQLKYFLDKKEYSVGHILIVDQSHLPNDNIFGKVYGDLNAIFKNVSIGTGVNAYFAELNRNRPQTSEAEFINFAICPQVHAFDDSSMIENLEAQKYVLNSAKGLFPQKPIYISPVTLKQRFDIVSTSKDDLKAPDELPAQVDVRQNSIFAAQWLLGSVKFLSQSGAGLVTFFESVGWFGFIQGDFRPPLPEKFGARTGDIFPVYHMLMEFIEYNKVIYSESNLPLCIEGIALQNNDNRVKLLIANFSDRKKIVEIESAIKWNKGRLLLSNCKLMEIKSRVILPSKEILILEGL